MNEVCVLIYIYIYIFIWHGRKSTYINANIHEHRYPQQTHKQTKKKHNCRHTHIRTNTHILRKINKFILNIQTCIHMHVYVYVCW